MIIVDAHEDLAWNALTFGRDYTSSVAATRELERETDIPEYVDDSMIGWPDHQRGQVALVFGTLFAAPLRWKGGEWEHLCYVNSLEAGSIYRRQLDYYDRLEEEHPEKFRRITSCNHLESLLSQWQKPPVFDPQSGELLEGRPVGLLTLMEGADAVRDPLELEEWWQRGVRLVGPAWGATRYSGGWREPGPLTPEGTTLLEGMAELGFGLDLSHMDPAAAYRALDIFEGEVIASHSNISALLKDDESNRHLPDRLIRGIIERDGVIGIVLYNAYLKAGWRRRDGRQEVGLERVVRQIDTICQMAGNAQHVGIGSDFDGGIGLQSAPAEMNSIADLQLLGKMLLDMGYSADDASAVLSGNWLRKVKNVLPEEI